MVMSRHLSASVEYRPVDDMVVPNVTGSVQLPTVARAGDVTEIAANAAVPSAIADMVFFIFGFLPAAGIRFLLSGAALNTQNGIPRTGTPSKTTN